MTRSGIPRLPLDEAKAAADEAGVPDYMAELSIFQVLLNHPVLARTLNDLLATMLWHGALDSRLRELVIMRIGWLTACDYEWTQHWRVASGLGVPADDLLGVRDWPAYEGFGPTERAVLAATDDVVRDGAVSAESWVATERFSSNWSPRSERGEWSPRSCTASRSRWRTAWPAGRPTADRRRCHSAD
jgi:alkylhydroperoxidase family enzyme